jgi:glycosyltransferase involved in cell wall biosynthesis
MAPRLSVVVLTWNEADNVAACLQALAKQDEPGIEVILVDAASTDATVAIASSLQATLPYPLRIVVADTRISVGAARNRGVASAQAPVVAFLSADTEPAPEWARFALRGLADGADLVFGRQVHAPTRPTVGAAVRGLRYHFPDGPTDQPARYASHVNAAIRRQVLLTFPIGTTPGASAVDDILLARRAAQAGLTLAYEPGMLVRHRDVSSWRGEMTKNKREGLGLGEHSAELGVRVEPLLWAGLMAAALAWLVLLPGLVPAFALLGAVWLPTLRRAVRRHRAMPARLLLVGVAASPVFDLAFLLAYLRGLLRRKALPSPAIGREVDP